jgi:RNA polymerase sigma-70 factor (ECF subfamily)
MGLALVRDDSLMRDVEDGARVILLPGAALADSDDATLARALIARDPRAPRVLWQRFAPMVFRMLRRTLGSDHDLDDLAQEVFLCVFEKVRALREP